MNWTRNGDAYVAKYGDDIKLVVEDHRWCAAVFLRGDRVHLSEHAGQDEAFNDAAKAAQRARHLRRFLPNAPARPKPDAVPPPDAVHHPYC